MTQRPGTSPRLRRRDLRPGTAADAAPAAQELPGTGTAPDSHPARRATTATADPRPTRRELRLAAEAAAAGRAPRPVRRRDLRAPATADAGERASAADTPSADPAPSLPSADPAPSVPGSDAVARVPEADPAPSVPGADPGADGGATAARSGPTRRELRARERATGVGSAQRASLASARATTTEPSLPTEPAPATPSAPSIGPATDTPVTTADAGVPAVPTAPPEVDALVASAVAPAVPPAAAPAATRRRDLRGDAEESRSARRADPRRPGGSRPGGAGRRRATRHRRPAVRASLLAAAAAAGVMGVGIPLVQQTGAVADAPAALATVAPAQVATFSALTDVAASTSTIAPELLARGDAGARADYAAASRSDVREDMRCSPAVAASGARAALAEQETAVLPVASDAHHVSSRYGNRVHPITGRWSFHTGDDFAAPYGTPIHAVADGVVVHAGPGIEGRSGTLVIIEHELDGQVVETWSTHMAPSGVHVTVGDRVVAGQHIADIGSWGNSTGPHLHLEIHVAGETVAPIAFLESIGAIDPSEIC